MGLSSRVSVATRLHDLLELVACGMLVPEGQGMISEGDGSRLEK